MWSVVQPQGALAPVRPPLAGRLPGPVSGQVDKLLGGEGGDGQSEGGGLLGKIEGLLGKKD